MLEGYRAHCIAEFSIEAEADVTAQRHPSSKTYTGTCLRSSLRASIQLPLQGSFRYNNASELEVFSAQYAELLRPSPSICASGTVSPSTIHRILTPTSQARQWPVPPLFQYHLPAQSSTTNKIGNGVYLLPLGHLRGRRGLRFVVHGCVARVPATVAFFAALSLCASLAHSPP